MEPASLSYLIAHPAALGLGAERPLLLLLLPAALVFLWWPFHGPGAQRPPISAGALRAAAFTCLVLALAGVRLTTRVPTDRLTLVAAVDLSASIDAAGREWARRYLNQIAAALAPGDDLAIVTFAGDAQLYRGPEPPAPVAEWPDTRGDMATDLGRAIETGMSLFPGDGARRLVLLTDGRETRGNSRRLLPWLRHAGVRIDAAVPPRQAEPDVRIDKVVAPPLVGAATTVPIRVVVHNGGGARSAVLNLYLDDQIIDSTAVEVPPGRIAVVFPTQLTAAGSHRLRAEVALEGDPIVANNSRDVAITIRGPTRVLLATARSRSALAESLVRKGFHVTVQPPSALRDAQALRGYHLVLLEDVTAAELPATALAAVERWVRDFGGGLLVAGGATTFGDADFVQTPLRRLLPITLEPHRPRPGGREPIALFLVIDRSNSMGYNSRIGTLRDGEKLRYAKEAALAVIRQLKDQDLVGVIAFDSQPHEISRLAALSKTRGQLEQLIPRIVENGGTDFYDALESARQQLIASRATRRHIILLTDGDTNRAAPVEYRALTKDLRDAQISVTTIRIGDNTVNLKLLKEISGQTGGEFHYVENAEMLPDLMLRETSRALAPTSPGEEQFLPRVAAPTQVLAGIEESRLPPLAGYAYAKLKPGAERLLEVTRLDRHDPLLAAWQYGLGRVAAFTASPSDDAEQWPGWPEYSKFWSQLVHWVAREHSDDEVAIEAHRTDDATEIVVRTYGPTADGAVLFGRVQLDDETTRTLDLAPREPRVFAGRLLDILPGTYPLTLVKREANGSVSQHTELITVAAGDRDRDAEVADPTPNRALLTQLCEATGGTLDPAPRVLTERELGTARASYPLDWLYLPLAMVLFLADTTMRKLYRGGTTLRPRAGSASA